MKRWLGRLLMGLVFALPLALVSFALAQAGPAVAGAPPGEDPDCQSCHAGVQQSWEAGAHANALSDPVFKTAWAEQGQAKECLSCHTTGFDAAAGAYQAEGVTCGACHEPVPGNHPLSPASMSRSSELCATCHRDTQFEWQNSRHGQSDLTCVSCHDPHATNIRAAEPSELCAACHGTRVAAFEHSLHAEEGLTCTDCHIGDTGAQPGLGNGSKSHTFEVNLNTCTRCHETEIHSPSAAMLNAGEYPGTPPPPASLNSGLPATVSEQPRPVGPAGFALFAGLVGLAFGIVLAPWLERGLRRVVRTEPVVEVER